MTYIDNISSIDTVGMNIIYSIQGPPSQVCTYPTELTTKRDMTSWILLTSRAIRDVKVRSSRPARRFWGFLCL